VDRSIRRRSVLAAGVTAAMAMSAGRAAAASPHSPQVCTMPALLSVQKFTQVENMFTAYGNAANGNEWSGGDSTYSARLADGRQVWLFSDTFLGPVQPDGSRPGAPFINNSIVVEQNGQLSTIHGGTQQNPAAVVTPTAPDSWYWANACNVTGSTLNVIYLEFKKTGSGIFDFAWQRNVLVRYSLPSLAVLDITALPSAVPNLQWNPWLLQVGSFTYIYGVEDLGATKYMRIARVSGTNLLGAWQFWTGSGWSSVESASVRVMANVSNNYSVTPMNGGYLLITQDTSEIFSSKIVGYFGPSPTGPFTQKTLLYVTPETGPTGTYGNQNIIMYAPHEHPQYRQGNKIVLSYDVNSLNSDDVWNDASIYRSRFIALTFATCP
jgi:hypothetical protein